MFQLECGLVWPVVQACSTAAVLAGGSGGRIHRGKLVGVARRDGSGSERFALLFLFLSLLASHPSVFEDFTCTTPAY